MMKKILFIILVGILLSGVLGWVLAQNGAGDNACGTTKPIEECHHQDPLIQDFLFTCGYYQRQVQLGNFSINDPVVQDIQEQGCPFPETPKNKGTGSSSSSSSSSSSNANTGSGGTGGENGNDNGTDPMETDTPRPGATPMTTEEPGV